jgi:hypothetical protein
MTTRERFQAVKAGGDEEGGGVMRGARAVLRLAVAAALAGSMLAVSGCYGIPTGTVKKPPVGGVKLKVTPAVIVMADGVKTTYRIRCAVCGCESKEITIDTPRPGKPFTTVWICPKCGHKQQVAIK